MEEREDVGSKEYPIAYKSLRKKGKRPKGALHESEEHRTFPILFCSSHIWSERNSARPLVLPLLVLLLRAYGAGTPAVQAYKYSLRDFLPKEVCSLKMVIPFPTTWRTGVTDGHCRGRGVLWYGDIRDWQ